MDPVEEGADFGDWLTSQVERDDLTGMLARWADADTGFGDESTFEDFRAMLAVALDKIKAEWIFDS